MKNTIAITSTSASVLARERAAVTSITDSGDRPGHLRVQAPQFCQLCASIEQAAEALHMSIAEARDLYNASRR